MNDRDQAQHADAPGPAAEQAPPAPEGLGTQRVEAMLRSGRPPEAMVADILQQYPAERAAIAGLLNRTLGNAYVQAVMETPPPSKSAIQQATAILAPAIKEPETAPKKESPIKRLEHAIGASRDHVVHEAVSLAGGVEKLAVDIGQHLEVAGAEAVGVAELAGLKYPVKTYEAQVDAGLYRGSRLDDAGMAALKQQGIQGVCSLCLEHTEDAALAAKYGIAAINVKILDNSAPTHAQMMQFIDFARAHPPTYVHCEAGKGRTGTAVACYRIAVDGWTADRAIAEGRTYGLTLINQIAFIREFAESLGGAAPPAAPASDQR